MKKSSRMSIVHPHAAGVDIGAEFHVVAVPPDADTEPARTFQNFTGALQRMSDWLKTCHITTIAMESTGIYCCLLLKFLKLLVSKRSSLMQETQKMFPVARPMSTMPSGCRSCIHLVFSVPVSDLNTTFLYLRQRERLTEYRAAHIQHMQKALMQMNVQLHHAVSDISGVTGLSIVSGERDPSMLIQYRDVRCKKDARSTSTGTDREVAA
nr:Uncharacterised protein [Salmonella sp. NCTC 7297]